MPSLSNNNPLLRLCRLKKSDDREFGFTLDIRNPFFKQRFSENPNGLMWDIEKDSPAEMAGLKEGECILEMNGLRVSKHENWNKVKSLLKGNELELLILNPNMIEGKKFCSFCNKSTSHVSAWCPVYAVSWDRVRRLEKLRNCDPCLWCTHIHDQSIVQGKCVKGRCKYLACTKSEPRTAFNFCPEVLRRVADNLDKFGISYNNENK